MDEEISKKIDEIKDIVREEERAAFIVVATFDKEMKEARVTAQYPSMNVEGKLDMLNKVFMALRSVAEQNLEGKKYEP